MGNQKKDIDPQIKKDVEQLMKSMRCEKNFRCYYSHFEELCTIQEKDHEFICLSETPCLLSLGSKHCHCPIRIYLSKKLSK